MLLLTSTRHLRWSRITTKSVLSFSSVGVRSNKVGKYITSVGRCSRFSAGTCSPLRYFSSHFPNHEDKNHSRPPPPPQPKKSRGLIGGALFAGSVLLGKTKYVVTALKVTKMAPLASMLITSATYSLFFGWPYAIGL